MCPSVFDRHVSALDVTGVTQASVKSREKLACQFERCEVEKPDHRHRWLLRARRERPRRRAAERCDDLAAPHSITSSARASSVGGTSRPSALAVLRLIQNLCGRSRYSPARSSRWHGAKAFKVPNNISALAAPATRTRTDGQENRLSLT